VSYHDDKFIENGARSLENFTVAPRWAPMVTYVNTSLSTTSELLNETSKVESQEHS